MKYCKFLFLTCSDVHSSIIGASHIAIFKLNKANFPSLINCKILSIAAIATGSVYPRKSASLEPTTQGTKYPSRNAWR